MPPRAVHRVSEIFGVLRDRELRSFWMSDWVSDAGSFVTFIALAVMETTHQVLHTIGPAFGGLVVLLVGARPAFFVDSASFVLATLFLFGLRPRGRPPVGERASALRDLREGFRGLVAVPAVRA